MHKKIHVKQGNSVYWKHKLGNPPCRRRQDCVTVSHNINQLGFLTHLLPAHNYAIFSITEQLANILQGKELQISMICKGPIVSKR